MSSFSVTISPIETKTGSLEFTIDGSDEYGPNKNQKVLGEYPRHRELEKLWNAIDPKVRNDEEVQKYGGPHPQGEAETIPSLTMPK